ncbi:myb-like protein D isoform X2 [Gordionus sp. m RMFG-2023]|uniref:myb-like protein D isoform X2 n=1 Tax=Gordionus sp. m RMFG-2023 TaxID=3053472 RepID=UPI0031FE0223
MPKIIGLYKVAGKSMIEDDDALMTPPQQTKGQTSMGEKHKSNDTLITQSEEFESLSSQLNANNHGPVDDLTSTFLNAKTYKESKTPSPTLRKYSKRGNGGIWTQSEEVKLIKLVDKYGKAWDNLHTYFPHRTNINIKDKYRQLIKARKVLK